MTVYGDGTTNSFSERFTGRLDATDEFLYLAKQPPNGLLPAVPPTSGESSIANSR